MADAGFLELQQGTEPATPASGFDRVYVDSSNDHLKHKRPDGTVVDLDLGGSALTGLSGDVSATGPGVAVATVNSVGGSSAANIHAAELAANAATSSNTPSTIVKRDASGNFAAGTITASLTGSASNNVLKSGDTMTGALNVPTVNLTDTSGNGYVEHVRQVTPPATPASGHGYRLYSDNNGKFAYKSENGFTTTIDSTANTANQSYTLPNASGPLVIDPTTTTGDLIYRNSGGTLSRLPIGTTNQILTVSTGLPSWGDSSGNSFGDKSDGTVSVTGLLTLTGPVYYDTLTISGAGSIITNGYPLYCRTLDLSTASAAAIDWSGSPGNNSTGTGGGAAPGAGTNAYLAGGGNGTAGGASSTTVGAQAGTPAGQNPGNGGRSNTSGAGGAGAAGAQAGGAARNGANVTNSIKFGMLNIDALMMRNTAIIQGGSGGGGGGGGGGSGTQAGTGGGSGGGGGNVQAIFAQTIITTGSTASGAISAKGGVGGNAGNAANTNSGGGGGGAGAGGGYIYLVYRNKTGSAVTNLIDCSGATGGHGGNGNGTGAGGNGGDGGTGGMIDIINAATQTGNHIVGSTGGSGGAASGTTGGIPGTAGPCVFSL